jgi:ribose transport system permease protein
MTTQAVSGRRYFTKAWLMEQKSLIALLVLIAIVSTMSPNFFTVNNLFNILQQTSVNAIMAVGMTLVILTSGSTCPSVPCWRSPARWRRRLSGLR